MRRSIFTLLLIFSFSLFANAQARVGALIGYGEKISLWGLGANVEVMATDRIGISPSFVYYFPKRMNADNKTTMWEWNANANYYMIYGDNVNLYAIGGFNYSTIRNENDNPLTDAVDHDYNAGLNLGAAVQFRAKSVLPFLEAKFTVGSYSQFAVFGGVKYEFGRWYERDVDDY